MLTNEQQCPLQHVKQTTCLHPALEKQGNEKRGSRKSRKAIRSCLKAGNKYINKTGEMKLHSATSHSTLQQEQMRYLLCKKGNGKMFMGHF